MKAIKLPGGRTVEVVGEASYQQALASICRPKCEDGYQLLVSATLGAEPDNPHDEHAVAIYVDGKKVAYLARADAPAYQALLLRLERRAAYAYCDALIVGGWDRGDCDTGHYGVKLDLAPVERCESVLATGTG